MDAVYLAALAAFFLITIAIAAACEKLGGR
jgi:hypothetical protein